MSDADRWNLEQVGRFAVERYNTGMRDWSQDRIFDVYTEALAWWKSKVATENITTWRIVMVVNQA